MVKRDASETKRFSRVCGPSARVSGEPTFPRSAAVLKRSLTGLSHSCFTAQGVKVEQREA